MAADSGIPSHSQRPDTGPKLPDGAALDPDDDADTGEAREAHDFFSTAAVDESSAVTLPSEGDLWVSCWSADDALYVANGDGAAFASTLTDIAVSRLNGRPDDRSDPLSGVTLARDDQIASIWNPRGYNRKPTGMACVNGELYLAVQDLSLTYDDAPAATIVRSTDKGRTWSWDRAAPMVADHLFTTIMFLDFGKDGQHAIDDFVYAYGLDHNWAYNGRRGAPTKLYLARVPELAIQDRSQWEFFSGTDARGAPTWNLDMKARRAVLEDERRVYAMPLDAELAPRNMTVVSQGSIIYNAPLRRYIYTSWTEYTHEFYESPTPWGPWKLFLSKDYGAYPWIERKNGGYATTIPAKFISSDGLTMFVQSNSWGPSHVENYGFSLRKLRVTPYAASVASNPASSQPLSTRADTVPIVRALSHGRIEILNDGRVARQSDDSQTGEAKPRDFWGYTWPVLLRMNKLVYATGLRSFEGGWFEDLSIEVRRAGSWSALDAWQVTPAYAYDASVRSNAQFTFEFAECEADGIRIIGRPGGAAHFTTVSELGVYFQP
jgi:hypothetical protein